MKKFFKQIKTLLVIFLLWRVALFVISYLGLKLLPFGYSYPYWDRALAITNLPEWLWSWGGFDGVHYLRLAQNGYKDAFTQAFFPLFPLLISALATLFPKIPNLDHGVFVDPAYLYSGLVLSLLFGLFFVVSIFLYFKSVHKKQALNLVFLALIFPTSFFLGGLYTEGLFLGLSALTFYFLKKENVAYAGVVAFLAGLTRVTGLFHVVPLLFWAKKKGFRKLSAINWLSVFSPVLGVGAYMVYLWKKFGDPLLFLNAQPGFGAERSASLLTTLPQVFVRYFRILTTVPTQSSQFVTAALEVWFVFLAFYLLLRAFRKVDWGIWWFVLLSVLAPTLTGTFSSMPRYVLVSVFLLPALELKGVRKVVYLTLSAALLIVFTIMFTRGYWVA